MIDGAQVDHGLNDPCSYYSPVADDGALEYTGHCPFSEPGYVPNWRWRPLSSTAFIEERGFFPDRPETPWGLQYTLCPDEDSATLAPVGEVEHLVRGFSNQGIVYTMSIGVRRGTDGVLIRLLDAEGTYNAGANFNAIEPDAAMDMGLHAVARADCDNCRPAFVEQAPAAWRFSQGRIENTGLPLDVFIPDATLSQTDVVSFALYGMRAADSLLFLNDYDIPTDTLTEAGWIGSLGEALSTVAPAPTSSEALIVPMDPERPAWWTGGLVLTGQGTQDSGSSWTIEIRVDAQGSATIRYPSLDCGGLLALTGYGNGGVELQESITENRSRCTDGGIVRIAPTIDADTYRFLWEKDGRGADGSLSVRAVDPAVAMPESPASTTLADAVPVLSATAEPPRKFQYLMPWDGFAQTPPLTGFNYNNDGPLVELVHREGPLPPTFSALRPNGSSMIAVPELTRDMALSILRANVIGSQYVLYPNFVGIRVTDFNQAAMLSTLGDVVGTPEQSVTASQIAAVQMLHEERREDFDEAALRRWSAMFNLGLSSVVAEVTSEQFYDQDRYPGTHGDRLIAYRIGGPGRESENNTEEPGIIVGGLEVGSVLGVFETDTTAEVQFDLAINPADIPNGSLRSAIALGIETRDRLSLVSDGVTTDRWLEQGAAEKVWTAHFRLYDDGWRLWRIE